MYLDRHVYRGPFRLNISLEYRVVINFFRNIPVSFFFGAFAWDVKGGYQQKRRNFFHDGKTTGVSEITPDKCVLTLRCKPPTAKSTVCSARAVQHTLSSACLAKHTLSSVGLKVIGSIQTVPIQACTVQCVLSTKLILLSSGPWKTIWPKPDP